MKFHWYTIAELFPYRMEELESNKMPVQIRVPGLVIFRRGDYQVMVSLLSSWGRGRGCWPSPATGVERPIVRYWTLGPIHVRKFLLGLPR